MMEILPLAAVLVIALVLTTLLFIRFGLSEEAGKKKSRKKSREAVINEANRRLAQNPKDCEALSTLAELYYSEEAWEKSFRTYGVLMDLCGISPELNEFEINFRYAVSAMKLKDFDEAYKGFLIARGAEADVFEINYNLGYLEFRRKAYEKAASLLKQALGKQPEHVQTMKYLGHSLFKLGRAKEALPLLRRVIDQEPDDKETLFLIGQCYYEVGYNDQAVRIFTHLRPDPLIGPQAALFSGTIHLRGRQYEKAVLDFEVGLRHQELNPDVLIELKYRLAAAYTKQQEIAKALSLLQQIRDVAPHYKDVAIQIDRHRELNSNKNLQIFLMSPTSDFVTLCRKIVTGFIPRSRVKIIDITVQKSDYADILAEVETSEWQDIILYRFIRSNGAVGELMLRDFHARLKETKSGRGYCVAAGEYSDEAKRFVEARLIDLIDKEGLSKILKTA